MSRRYCVWSIALLTLSSHPALLAAQGTTAPAPGMAVRWHDTTGGRNGTITTVMPDGSYLVDLLDSGGRRLARVATIDPATTPGVEVRIAHRSDRGLGAILGGTAGFTIAASSRPKSNCNEFDHWVGCAWGKIALLFGSTTAGGAIGALIAGQHSTWIPAPVHGSPARKEPGVMVRPLLTWHDGPAVGLRVRF